MERKQFKAAALDGEGTGTARIAQLGVVDLDNDVVLPGALGRQAVTLLPSHDWSHVALGKAVVREEGNAAIADFKMNLAIAAARDLHEALKFDLLHPPPTQQWSWGFSIRPGGSRRGEFAGQQVRFLQPLPNGEPGVELHEISTVLKGASIGTETLAVKRRGSADSTPRSIYEIAEKVSTAAAMADAQRRFHNSLAESQRLRFEETKRRLDTVAYVETTPPEWMLQKAHAAIPSIERALGASGTVIRWFKTAAPGDAETFRAAPLWGRADRVASAIWICTEVPAGQLARIIAHEVGHLTEPPGLLPHESERHAESREWAASAAREI